LDSVGFYRHFNELPEDSQEKMAVREGFEPSVPQQLHKQLIYKHIQSST
jgi:hypothetical protein